MSIRITELDAVVALQNGDYIVVDNESAGTHKFDAMNLGSNIGQNIASTYSSSATYAIGQYCLYNNNLYVCKTTISTPEAWNATHWTQVTVGGELYKKVDKVNGKSLSTNDFTDAYKNKLDGIEAGAETNVQADWAENDSSKDDYIKNKPGVATDNTSGLMSATDKQKLDNIESGAEVNVQADWAESDSSKDDYIKNKPTIDSELSTTSTNAVENQAIGNAVETINGDIDTINDTLENKANIDGYYEEMSVGSAEQLLSDMYEEDKVPYLFRPSGGSLEIGDRSHNNEIVGVDVAWNQITRIKNGGDSYTELGVTISNNSGIFELSGTLTSYKYISVLDNLQIIEGHKYLLDSKIIANPNNLDFKYAMLNANPKVDAGASGIFISGYTKATGFGFDSMTIGADYTGIKLYLNCFDLTVMFGTAIADYIYNLEQTTAGAGVAWFKKLFPNDYYEYDTGSLKSVEGLQSHKMVGFNQWDEEWENGSFNFTTGEKAPNVSMIRSKNMIPVFPNTAYYAFIPYTPTTGGFATPLFYDKSGNYISYINIASNGATFTTPNDAHYMMFTVSELYGTTYNHDICINFSDPSRNGEYEPYVEHEYPLDDSLTLRGIPKLDANNKLYYDGDIYSADGTVTRRYGVVDLGTLEWSRWGNNVFASNGIQTLVKYPENTSTIINMLCTAFLTNTYLRVITEQSVYGISISTSGAISIHSEVDYSTSADFKTAMSGVYLVYELAEPTTEQADPYQEIQIVDNLGTEEFVINLDVAVPIPVGHVTQYPPDLKAKIEVAPNSPNGDGDYIMRRTNGENAYVQLVIPEELPATPSTDGTYTLQVVVADGTPTLSWVSNA